MSEQKAVGEELRVLWPGLTWTQARVMLEAVQKSTWHQLGEASGAWLKSSQWAVEHCYEAPGPSDMTAKLSSSYYAGDYLTPAQVEMIHQEMNRAIAHYIRITEELRRMDREVEAQYMQVLDDTKTWQDLADQAYQYFHPDPVDDDGVSPMWDDPRDNP